MRSPTSTNLSIYSVKSLFSLSSLSSSTSSVDSHPTKPSTQSTGYLTKLLSSTLEQTAAQDCDLLKKSPRTATFGDPALPWWHFQCPGFQRNDAITPLSKTSSVSSLNSSLSRGFEDQIPGWIVFICRDKETQAFLDQHQISSGTQYKLARGFLWGPGRASGSEREASGFNWGQRPVACQVQIIMRGKPATSASSSDSCLWHVLSHRFV